MNLLSIFTREAHAGVGTTVTNPLATLFPAAANITLAGIFSVFINIAIAVGIALTIIFLILGGINYMTAQGDSKKADNARSALTNAVIGFVVVVFAVAIKAAFSNVLQVTAPGGTDIVPF